MKPPSIRKHKQDPIDVVTTTVSGSLQDQRKVGRIGKTFESRTSRPVVVHVADSHAEAREMAGSIVAAGGRTLISAGGAGTFNAVLEGAHLEGAIPRDLRLGFLRKGSADLIGKALRMPDDLALGVEAVLGGIESGSVVVAAVLSVAAPDSEGVARRKPLVGFGGVGIFGDVPLFTESRLVKLYKGVLGSAFGDYGPFYVGLGLAFLRWHVLRSMGRVSEMALELEGATLGPSIWTSVIVVNGHLGDAFPLGRGLSLGDATFRMVALRDNGLRASVTQVGTARTGRLLRDPSRYGAEVVETGRLTIRPMSPGPFMINVDGVRLMSHGEVEIEASGEVRLIAGGPSPTR